MKTKTSKAQTEVWEWKENLYNQTHHLSLTEQINYLINKAANSVSKIKRGTKKSYR
jgi:hypothetical protein